MFLGKWDFWIGTFFLRGKSHFFTVLDTRLPNTTSPFVFSFIVCVLCTGLDLILEHTTSFLVTFQQNTSFRPPIFRSHKTSFFRGKTVKYNLLSLPRVYTHELSQLLKKALFTRKNGLFLDRKTLFCEGFLKMCVLEVWETIFETLDKALKTEVSFECCLRSFWVFE